MESLTETVEDLIGTNETAETETELPSVQVSEPLTTTELVVPTGRTNGGSVVDTADSGAGTSVAIEPEESSSTIPIIDPTRNPLPETLSEINLEISMDDLGQKK